MKFLLRITQATCVTVFCDQTFILIFNIACSTYSCKMKCVHILGIFLLAISYESLGQSTPEESTCREPPVQANFALERFLGRWYEIVTTGGVPSYRCYVSDFTASNRTLRGSGTQKLNDGSWRKDINTLGQFSLKDPAKITYSANGGVALDYQQFFVHWYVLETDYNNYAIIWRCISSNATEENEENAWILGRKPTLSLQTFNDLESKLRDYEIDDLPFVLSPQDRYCTYPKCI